MTTVTGYSRLLEDLTSSLTNKVAAITTIKNETCPAKDISGTLLGPQRVRLYFKIKAQL